MTPGDCVGGDKRSLRTRYKTFRKRLLSMMPFIRRSRHERIVARVDRYLRLERKSNEMFGFLFFAPPARADSARHTVVVPLRAHVTDELCIFVTHAAAPQLKAHVVDHVMALCDLGVEVLLVVNTDLEPGVIDIPATMKCRLYGGMIRRNIGFDFAAWAHGYALIDPQAVRRRLYLINDSIVGPLDDEAYQLLLRRIRDSSADFLGLTCNPDSHEHLQSFYLVFNEALLHSPVFDGFMRNVVNMPSKQTVVDTYEIWLTPFLVRQGFSGEAMFPNLSREPAPRRDESLYNWRQLVAAGFPFVKAKVLTESPEAEEARGLLPERYRSMSTGMKSIQQHKKTSS